MTVRKIGGRAIALFLSAVLVLSGCGGAGKNASSAQSSETKSPEPAASAPAENGGTAEAGTEKEDNAGEAETEKETAPNPAVTNLPLIDMTKWQYNADDDVYWQVGIAYCEKPADEKYQTMGFFVPGAFFDAKDNGDGTFTCEMNVMQAVGNYTADNAPVILPINTPGYSAMAAPTGYDSSFGYGSVTDYTKEGMVVAFAGCRGRDHGAPLGVTDLKAAVRYIRYNRDTLPGAAADIFCAGMSGGGAQSAILGASGDSELYDPYLKEIGAVTGVSDAVQGAMCWCPITNLDIADEAYEWNLGASRTGLTKEEQKLSDGMAKAYADYINQMALTDDGGNLLTLEESKDGIWQAGSYYNYMVGLVETSLEHFLEDTTFPYDADASSGGHGGTGGPGGMGGRGGMGGPEGNHSGAMHSGLPEGLDGGPGSEPENGAASLEAPGAEAPDAAEAAETGKTDVEAETAGKDTEIAEKEAETAEKEAGAEDKESGTAEKEDGGGTDYAAVDNIRRSSGNQAAVTLSGTYETKEDYIAALNAPFQWVSYDEATGKVKITSFADFCKAMKPASKSLGAFDQLDAGQGENTLFGYGDGAGAHFDPVLAELAKGTEYEKAFAEDLQKKDFLGTSVSTRVDMYNPMYYLCDYYAGAGSSAPAGYWRIRTGISQGDTALCTEANLALALANLGPGYAVDFETVWGQGHTMAERTGESIKSFIEWVNTCEGN